MATQRTTAAHNMKSNVEFLQKKMKKEMCNV